MLDVKGGKIRGRQINKTNYNFGGNNRKRGREDL